jgi:hypothetical protein
MHEVLRHTVLNTIPACGSDPTILIREGYKLDSKIADLKNVKNAPANMTWNFINTKPEGPRQK